MPSDPAAGVSSTPRPTVGRRLIHFVPSFVWLTSLTMLCLLLLGTLVLPQLIIPDEKHHADMTLMAQEGTWIREGWPGLGDRRLDPAIVDASLSLGRREEALRNNRAGQHPPLFYVAAALTSSLVTFATDNLDLALHLWSFRLLSVLVSAALPITFYLIASELTSSRWIQLASAVLPLTIPGITLRDGPMINNDALLMLLTSLSILYAIRVAKGDLTKGAAMGLGLSTGLAALTKGTALVVLPVLVIAYLIHVVRGRQIARKWVKSVLISGGITFVVGGWWWIRNVVLYGAIQPVRNLSPVGEPVLNWVEWLTEATRRIVGSFWGGHFALGGRRYFALFWILTILLIVGCLVGWMRSRDRMSSSVAGLYALLLIPAVLGASALLYADRGRVSAVHGRYFYPGIAGIAPLAVAAIADTARRASRWLPALFVSGSLAMTLLAIGYMLERYWRPFGPGWDDQWSGVLASSPLPDAVAIVILVLTIFAFSTLIISSMIIGAKGSSTYLSPARVISPPQQRRDDQGMSSKPR